MRHLGLLWMIAGCHEASPPIVDGPSETSLEAGLYVTWGAHPTLPGPLTSSITLSQVTFQIDRFEVQSDADGGTSHSRYPLIWSAAATPAPEAFPDAPSGLYSRVAITLGGFYANAYEIDGTWLDHGKTKPFRIVDRVTLKTAFELSETLAAGGATTIGIAVELADALGGLDFHRLHDNNGQLELLTGDPQLVGFRARLAAAFQVGD
jgi:hypothetical protein